MSEREISVSTEQGVEKLEIMVGVPQGSVFGSTLWNIAFDEALRLPKPREVQLVAYADDVAVLVSAHAVPDLEVAATDTIERLQIWMEERGLTLAPHKSEAVIFSGRRAVDLPEIEIRGHLVPLTRSVKYLGVIMDRNLRFSTHVKTVAERAAAAATAVGRLMPNMGGPSTAKRTLLQSITLSRLMYAAPIWASELAHMRVIARRCSEPRGSVPFG